MAEIYIDPDYYNYTSPSAVTWTNGSATITHPGDITSDLAVGLPIAVGDPASTEAGVWYKVSSFSYDSTNNVTNITISPAWKGEDELVAPFVLNKGDGSVASPFSSLSQIGAIVADGDIVYCQSGALLSTRSLTLSPSRRISSHTPVLVTTADWKGTGATDQFTYDLNFSGGIKHVYLYVDGFWIFDNLKFVNGYNSYGSLSVGYLSSAIFRNCGFENFQSYCIWCSNGFVAVENCTFKNLNTSVVDVRAGEAWLIDCSYLGDDNFTLDSTVAFGSGFAYLINVDAPKGNWVASVRSGIITHCLNVSIPEHVIQYGNYQYGTYLHDYDGNATKYGSEAYQNVSTFTFSNGNPSIECGNTISDKVLGPYWFAPVISDYKVMLPAGTYTISTKVFVEQAVSTDPQFTIPPEYLFLEVIYFDDPNSNHRGIAKSTNAVTSGVENTLSVTFTQAKEGVVFLRVRNGASAAKFPLSKVYVEVGFDIS